MTRRRLPKGEGPQLRDEVVAATKALIEECGSTAEVSVRAIAKRVGVSPPAIYLHFADRDALIYETCTEMFSGFAARLEPLFSTPGTTLERLRQVGRAYVQWGLENAAIYPVLFNGEIKKPAGIDEDPGLTVLAGLIQMVRSGMADGEIALDRKPEAVAWSLWSGVHGLVMLLIGSKPWIEDHARAMGMSDLVPGNEELIDSVLDGLTAGLQVGF